MYEHELRKPGREIVAETDTRCGECLAVLQCLQFSDLAVLLDVMDSYYDGFEICDHTVNFEHAATILNRANELFSKLDSNHDGSLDYAELQGYERRHPEAQTELEWLRCHYEALKGAALLHHKSLQQNDLVTARNVFRGLEYVRRHFNSLTCSGSPAKIYPEDLLRLVCCKVDLSAHDAEGVWHLIHYMMLLQKREKKSHVGFTASEVEQLSPERLWS